MRYHRFLRLTGMISAACATFAFLPACGAGNATADKGGTFYGPSATVGDGQMKAYATLDKDGNPTAVGLRVSEAGLRGLPATDPAPPLMEMVDFPDQASATVFDHVMYNWNSQGHEPTQLFGKPHFDFHFAMDDMATYAAIQPNDPNFAQEAARLPDPSHTPAGFVVPPGPPVEQQAVPGMGVHLVDSAAPLVPGQYNFEQIFINGTWDGKYTFMEPMMTRDYLLTKPTLTEKIEQPQAYQRSGYFPTTYNIRFDDVTKEYVIELGGMQMRNAA